uniref:Ribosomal protein S3 n=1 Tax=Babesia rodhaini TaxID=5870 RepID=A0A455QZ64_BABRO|nr:ribosomal protein S3 [Babesia rodhaini]
MSKIISPIILRSKIFNQYLNNPFLYFKNKYKNIESYFKFFNIYINFILLFRNKLKKFKYFNIKYLYCSVDNINLKTVKINIIFSKLKKKFIIFILNFLLNINLYFNYFKKFKFYGCHSNNKFFILTFKLISYYNLFTPLNYLKYKFSSYKYFRKKLIYYCRKLMKYKYKNRFNILGIKILCSGRAVSWDNRTKIDIITVGNILIKTIKSRFFYYYDTIHTYKGSFGVQIWLNVN